MSDSQPEATTTTPSKQNNTAGEQYAAQLKQAQVKLRNVGVPRALRLKAQIVNKKNIIGAAKSAEPSDKVKKPVSKINPYVIGLLVFLVIVAPMIQLISSLFDTKPSIAPASQ